jgi:hypothetical protein
MLYDAKIIGYDGKQLLLAPTASIDRDLLQKQVENVEIRLVDGREITNRQRKKIFAIINDICAWNGDAIEDMRQYQREAFCAEYGYPPFSLHDVDRTTAREFIDHLINFCFRHNVPTSDTLLNCCDDVGRYLYMCLEHRKCAICNDPAEVHHVDRVGMGRDREKIVHVGLKAIALCRKHHNEAHEDEKDLFERYHVYGIRLDEYLCTCLNLNTKERK